jgi:excisionase family DNA binding protein
MKTTITDYLTVADAARELGLHPSSVRRLVIGGVIAARRVDGRTLLIPREAIADGKKRRKRGRPAKC